MRTNLIVQASDQQIVQQLGAQFDKQKRIWYIENVDDVIPFLPWIPKHLLEPCKPVLK